MNGKKIIAGLSALAMTLSLSANPVKAATGWVASGNDYYYYDANGSMVTGWIQLDYSWFMLDYETGKMKRGWVAANSSDWYWLSPGSGVMQFDYVVNDGGKQYYIGSDGIMVRNKTVTINGEKYTANGNGILDRAVNEVDPDKKNGWKNEGGQYYYYVNGVKKKGWLEIGDDTWYLGGSDYRMYYGGKYEIDGKTYEFAKNGKLIGEVKNKDYAKMYDPYDFRLDKKDVFELIQSEREYMDDSLDELTWVREDGLDKVAYIRAHELNDKFSSTRPNGDDLDDLLYAEDLDYETVEEFHVKADTASRAFGKLMDDRYFEDALENEDYTDVAVGVSETEDGSYNWTVIFASETKRSSSDFDADDYADEKEMMLDLLNDKRGLAGDLELAYDDAFDEAAYNRAVEVAKGKDDDDIYDFLDYEEIDYNREVFEFALEDVDDFEEELTDWLSTPANKRKIANKAYQTEAIGIADVGRKTYVSFIFIDEATTSDVKDYDYTEYKYEKKELAGYINGERTSKNKITYSTTATGLKNNKLNELAYYRAAQLALGEDDDYIDDYLDDNDYDWDVCYELTAEEFDDAIDAFDDMYYYDEDEVENSDYTKMGIGVYEEDGELYWVVILVG